MSRIGVRASELQGFQVRDMTLSEVPGTLGAARITRTAICRRVEPDQPTRWIYGTPESDATTDRVVPLSPWLATSCATTWLTFTRLLASTRCDRPNLATQALTD